MRQKVEAKGNYFRTSMIERVYAQSLDARSSHGIACMGDGSGVKNCDRALRASASTTTTSKLNSFTFRNGSDEQLLPHSTMVYSYRLFTHGSETSDFVKCQTQACGAFAASSA